jgi:hypothetical protein
MLKDESHSDSLFGAPSLVGSGPECDHQAAETRESQTDLCQRKKNSHLLAMPKGSLLS